MFENIDLLKLFDNEGEYGKEYSFGELTDKMISRAEKTIGYKLPQSYIELLRVKNGGVIDSEYDTWLSIIYGVGPEQNTFNGLEDMFDNWRYEWEYPDIGIPFGETESAGHDMYYMDFRAVDKNGEPRIVRIDNEMDNEIYFVADNLVEFLTMVYNNQEPQERLID